MSLQVLKHLRLEPPPEGVPMLPWVETLPPTILRATRKTVACLPPRFVTVGDCLRYMAKSTDATTAEIERGEHAVIAVPHPAELYLLDWIALTRTEICGYYQERIKNNPLLVRLSCSRERDGKRWLHVSCHRAQGLPSYDDLCRVKRVFIGEEKMALQLFPPKSQHVSDHDAVLHLWHCLDGEVTPDFRKGGTI